MSDRKDSGRRKTQLDEGPGPASPPPASSPPASGVQGYGGGPAHAGGRRATSLEQSNPAGRGPTIRESGGPTPGGQTSKRSKTVLDEGPGSVQGGVHPSAANLRRAIGWMISFDHNPVGQEYVIREGRTTIGNGRHSDISLFNDGKVSHDHCVFISRPRKGMFAVQDAGSTHGTIVNGEDIGIGKVADLHNGDFLTLGGTTFKLFLLDLEDIGKMWPSAE
ncbi:MAG: FHA domain-containing protein [Myxococcota bacterium]|nr:FHA domain-containing protein [Myxococcota bacterium]